MYYQPRLEDLQLVFDDLFFDTAIKHNCVMAYNTDGTCVARVELDENGDVKDWQGVGPVATNRVQGVLTTMRYWWEVEA